MQHGLHMTHNIISFYTCESIYVLARLMMSNLSFKTIYTHAIDMCMTVCRQTHVCQEHTCQIWITCMQIVSQGQQNYLYQNVHVLKCDYPHDTKRKSH